MYGSAWNTAHIVGRKEGEDNLRVYIAGLEAVVQIVIDSSEN